MRRQSFFTDRLCTQMEASPHTIAGYRDTFRLLVRYAGSRRGKPPTKLTIDDIDADLVAEIMRRYMKPFMVAAPSAPPMKPEEIPF